MEPYENEPSLPGWLEAKLGHWGGMPRPGQRMGSYKGFLMPNGTHLSTGNYDMGYEDHEDQMPDARTLAEWGWPGEIAKAREGPHGNSWAVMTHYMQRGQIARVSAHDGSHLSVHTEGPLTPWQKQAILDHVATHKPDSVFFYHMGNSEELRRHPEAWQVEDYMEQMDRMPRRVRSARERVRRAVRMAMPRPAFTGWISPKGSMHPLEGEEHHGHWAARFFGMNPEDPAERGRAFDRLHGGGWIRVSEPGRLGADVHKITTSSLRKPDNRWNIATFLDTLHPSEPVHVGDDNWQVFKGPAYEVRQKLLAPERLSRPVKSGCDGRPVRLANDDVHDHMEAQIDREPMNPSHWHAYADLLEEEGKTRRAMAARHIGDSIHKGEFTEAYAVRPHNLYQPLSWEQRDDILGRHDYNSPPLWENAWLVKTDSNFRPARAEHRHRETPQFAVTQPDWVSIKDVPAHFHWQGAARDWVAHGSPIELLDLLGHEPTDNVTLGFQHTYPTLTHDNGDDQLFQSDWDWQSLAQHFGWQPSVDEGQPGYNHADMTAEAYDYLRDHEGESIPDPGYFSLSREGRPVRNNRETISRLWDQVKAKPGEDAHWHALADAMEEAGKPNMATALRHVAGFRVGMPNSSQAYRANDARRTTYHGVLAEGTVLGVPAYLAGSHLSFGGTVDPAVYWNVAPDLARAIASEFDQPQAAPERFNRETIGRLWEHLRADPHDDARWHALADAFEEAGKPAMAEGFRTIPTGEKSGGKTYGPKIVVARVGESRRIGQNTGWHGQTFGVPMFLCDSGQFWVGTDRPHTGQGCCVEGLPEEAIQRLVSEVESHDGPFRFNRETVGRLWEVATERAKDPAVWHALADAFDEAGKPAHAEAFRAIAEGKDTGHAGVRVAHVGEERRKPDGQMDWWHGRTLGMPVTISGGGQFHVSHTWDKRSFGSSANGLPEEHLNRLVAEMDEVHGQGKYARTGRPVRLRNRVRQAVRLSRSNLRTVANCAPVRLALPPNPSQFNVTRRVYTGKWSPAFRVVEYTPTKLKDGRWVYREYYVSRTGGHRATMQPFMGGTYYEDGPSLHGKPVPPEIVAQLEPPMSTLERIHQQLVKTPLDNQLWAAFADAADESGKPALAEMGRILSTSHTGHVRPALSPYTGAKWYSRAMKVPPDEATFQTVSDGNFRDVAGRIAGVPVFFHHTPQGWGYAHVRSRPWPEGAGEPLGVVLHDGDLNQRLLHELDQIELSSFQRDRRRANDNRSDYDVLMAKYPPPDGHQRAIPMARFRKPDGCNCAYPDKVLRNGSGHGKGPDGKPCPVHMEWLRENIFGRPRRQKMGMRDAIRQAIRLSRGGPVRFNREAAQRLFQDLLASPHDPSRWYAMADLMEESGKPAHADLMRKYAETHDRRSVNSRILRPYVVYQEFDRAVSGPNNHFRYVLGIPVGIANDYFYSFGAHDFTTSNAAGIGALHRDTLDRLAGEFDPEPQRLSRPTRFNRETIGRLHAQVAADPTDEASWHAMADALEEAGKPHTASAIRQMLARPWVLESQGKTTRPAIHAPKPFISNYATRYDWDGGTDFAESPHNANSRARGHVLGLGVQTWGVGKSGRATVWLGQKPWHPSGIALVDPETMHGMEGEMEDVTRYQFARSGPTRFAQEDEQFLALAQAAAEAVHEHRRTGDIGPLAEHARQLGQGRLHAALTGRPISTSAATPDDLGPSTGHWIAEGDSRLPVTLRIDRHAWGNRAIGMRADLPDGYEPSPSLHLPPWSLTVTHNDGTPLAGPVAGTLTDVHDLWHEFAPFVRSYPRRYTAGPLGPPPEGTPDLGPPDDEPGDWPQNQGNLDQTRPRRMSRFVKGPVLDHLIGLIGQNPSDPNNQCALADFLEENGMPAHADLIRRHVEAGRQMADLNVPIEAPQGGEASLYGTTGRDDMLRFLILHPGRFLIRPGKAYPKIDLVTGIPPLRTPKTGRVAKANIPSIRHWSALYPDVEAMRQAAQALIGEGSIRLDSIGTPGDLVSHWPERNIGEEPQSLRERMRRALQLAKGDRMNQAVRLLAMKDRAVSPAGAATRVESGNHQLLVHALHSILDRSGLRPNKVYPAVHDYEGQARAAVVAAVFGTHPHGQAEYGAAWQGLVARLPGLVVFHSHPQGADSVYRFAFKGPQHAMSKLLDQAGVPNRVFVPHKETTHVFLYDPGRKSREAVGQLASTLGLVVTEHLGNAHPIGGGDDLGRADYRDEIRRQEQMSRPEQFARAGKRAQVIELLKAGKKPSEVARELGISEVAVTVHAANARIYGEVPPDWVWPTHPANRKKAVTAPEEPEAEGLDAAKPFYGDVEAAPSQEELARRAALAHRPPEPAVRELHAGQHAELFLGHIAAQPGITQNELWQKGNVGKLTGEMRDAAIGRLVKDGRVREFREDAGMGKFRTRYYPAGHPLPEGLVPSRQDQILAHHKEGLSYGAIGKKLNISKSRVFQAIQSAKAKGRLQREGSPVRLGGIEDWPRLGAAIAQAATPEEATGHKLALADQLEEMGYPAVAETIRRANGAPAPGDYTIDENEPYVPLTHGFGVFLADRTPTTTHVQKKRSRLVSVHIGQSVTHRPGKWEIVVASPISTTARPRVAGLLTGDADLLARLLIDVGPDIHWDIGSGEGGAPGPEHRQEIENSVAAALGRPGGGPAAKMNRETIGRLAQQVDANPDADHHWHALADALEEAGKPHTAQLIRHLVAHGRKRPSPWRYGVIRDFDRIHGSLGDYTSTSGDADIAGMPMGVSRFSHGWILRPVQYTGGMGVGPAVAFADHDYALPIIHEIDSIGSDRGHLAHELAGIPRRHTRLRFNRETVSRLWAEVSADPHDDARWHALGDALEEAGKPHMAQIARLAAQGDRLTTSTGPSRWYDAVPDVDPGDREGDFSGHAMGVRVLGSRTSTYTHFYFPHGRGGSSVFVDPGLGRLAAAEIDPHRPNQLSARSRVRRAIRLSRSPVRLNRETIGRLWDRVNAEPHTDAHWHAIADAFDEAGKPNMAQLMRHLAEGTNTTAGGRPYKCRDLAPGSGLGRNLRDDEGEILGVPVSAHHFTGCSFVFMGQHGSSLFIKDPAFLAGLVSEFDPEPERFAKKPLPGPWALSPEEVARARIDSDNKYLGRDEEYYGDAPRETWLSPKHFRTVTPDGGKNDTTTGWTPVKSSWIIGIRRLKGGIIDFMVKTGQAYRYRMPPGSLWRWLAASSKGRFWWSNIRGRYSPAQKLGRP